MSTADQAHVDSILWGSSNLCENKKGKYLCSKCRYDKQKCSYDGQGWDGRLQSQPCDRCTSLKLGEYCDTPRLPAEQTSEPLLAASAGLSPTFLGRETPTKPRFGRKKPVPKLGSGEFVWSLNTTTNSAAEPTSRVRQSESDPSHNGVACSICEAWKEKIRVNFFLRQQASLEADLVEYIITTLGANIAYQRIHEGALASQRAADLEHKRHLEEGELLSAEHGPTILRFLLCCQPALSRPNSTSKSLWEPIDFLSEYSSDSLFDSRETVTGTIEMKADFYHCIADKIVKTRNTYNVYDRTRNQSINCLAAHLAYREKEFDTAIWIEKKATRPLQIDIHGRSLLHHAIHDRNVNFVKRILEVCPKWISCTQQDCFGLSPLAIAAMRDHVGLFDILNKEHEPLRLMLDHTERCVLGIAARAGSYRIACLILSEGEFHPICSPDRDFECALEGGHNSVVDLLHNYLRTGPQIPPKRLQQLARAARTAGRGDLVAGLLQFGSTNQSVADAGQALFLRKFADLPASVRTSDSIGPNHRVSNVSLAPINNSDGIFDASSSIATSGNNDCIGSGGYPNNMTPFGYAIPFPAPPPNWTDNTPNLFSTNEYNSQVVTSPQALESSFNGASLQFMPPLQENPADQLLDMMLDGQEPERLGSSSSRYHTYC